MSDKYFTQYVVACADNGFKAHYVIYEKGTLKLANKTKYKTFYRARKAKRLLEEKAGGTA